MTADPDADGEGVRNLPEKVLLMIRTVLRDYGYLIPASNGREI